jgi:hypothetical protein
MVRSTERDEVAQAVHRTAFCQRHDVVDGQVALRLATLTVLDRGAAVAIAFPGRVSSLAPRCSVPDAVLRPAVPLPFPRFEAGRTAPPFHPRGSKGRIQPLQTLSSITSCHPLLA